VALPSIGAGKSSFRLLRLAAQSLSSSIRRFVQTQFKLRTSQASGRMLRLVNTVPCSQPGGSAAQPNPSLKGRSNGVPPSPGHRVACAHFLWPGLGVPPSASPLVQTLDSALRHSGLHASQFKSSFRRPLPQYRLWCLPFAALAKVVAKPTIRPVTNAALTSFGVRESHRLFAYSSNPAKSCRWLFTSHQTQARAPGLCGCVSRHRTARLSVTE
jgi:hypothetical protein